VTLVTMWLGARLVIEGSLSLGQLIAFNMLAGRVATTGDAPGAALDRLPADRHFGAAPGRHPQHAHRARRKGQGRAGCAQRHRACRRWPGASNSTTWSSATAPTARKCCAASASTIAPGEVIGIVGRSGSGKSTLAKLAQRLYLPERGRVLADGIDLALADSSSLRRQIGVVLQENMLFNRTIRDNIALADPGLPIEAVMAAAKLAGAHEFILELPEAYDTVVGEHGATLSGGQRQRIAIARALIGNPRILIFDEATSALDYESERIIQNNMKAICQGRTVIVIAHRLSAVRDANRIIVIDRGQIVEQGSHAELLRHEAGHYSRLHRMQQG
jgi:subfamily B ATP-binding cassette protein HlyB/CyaB